jgi:hypothetical protein
MNSRSSHKWAFPVRIRKNAYGWRSSGLAVQRIKEAISEIKKVSRVDSVAGGEGAVLFLEKVSSALMQVDGSSGALGTAVNKAIESLVPIITKADADDKLRDQWIERLWQAVEVDDMPYIEQFIMANTFSRNNFIMISTGNSRR